MTVATTGVSVQQMRGRSLRLDPADPAKVASNWDVVCVAPDLVRGSGDYERFVRKHLHLFAPAEDGEVEAGPSHVHPELGPFGPPEVDRFGALNAEQIARAADLPAARERWQVGTPYRGVELPTLLVRRNDTSAPAPARQGANPRRASLSAPAARRRAGRRGRVRRARRWRPRAVLLAGLALAPAGLAWAALRLRAAKRRLPIVLPLDAAARAVVDAYRELDELGRGRRVAADRAAHRRLPALRTGRARLRTRASASPPRSMSWSSVPTTRAISSPGRWPIRTAGRSPCSAGC